MHRAKQDGNHLHLLTNTLEPNSNSIIYHSVTGSPHWTGYDCAYPHRPLNCFSISENLLPSQLEYYFDCLIERMNASAPTGFFGLPSELRNEIYSIIAYHHDTGGTISPLADKTYSHPSIGLLDGKRYPIMSQDHYYSVNKVLEKPEKKQFKKTTNAVSKHFCTSSCLQPPDGASRACRQMREEVLAIFYGLNTFHLEMSNFEVTDAEGIPSHRWSPVNWWRATGDTNLRRITNFSLVCHPTNKETKDINILFQYRWVDNKPQASLQRVEQLAWEKVRRATVSQITINQPPNRHPLDITRFEKYRLQKWMRNNDFEASIASEVTTMQDSGLHVQALEKMAAAMEPWDLEYLLDHMSLDDDLVVGTVKEGRGELALRWDFLS